MRRKDMKPGVLYAIAHSGNWRPGLVLDAKTERVRVRVYWTWPGTLWPYDSPVDPDRLETDYLNPHPDILDPRAKYDDKIVRTSDVLMEWTTWAVEERHQREVRLQERLQAEADTRATQEALIAERTASVEALRPLLDGVQGYLGIDHLLGQVEDYWTKDYYSARDVVTMLTQVAGKMQVSQ